MKAETMEFTSVVGARSRAMPLTFACITTTASPVSALLRRSERLL